MSQVKSGDKIKVHYHGKLTSGETFDSSAGREPLEFEVGSGQVIKGFDEGVTGMKVGEKNTVNMVIEMPKDRFPKDMEIEIGMPLGMSDQEGHQFQVTVVEIKDAVVMLDANHPLAGQDLIFDLELVEIVGASPLIIMP